jgi:hypothetical protein
LLTKGIRAYTDLCDRTPYPSQSTRSLYNTAVGIPQATLRSWLRPIDDILYIGGFLIILERRAK